MSLVEDEFMEVMNPRLPAFEQYAPYLKLIDKTRIYTNRGPLVKLLEKRYSEKLGYSNSDLVVLCTSATVAIQGFLQISDATTWHVPSFTFAGTVQAALQSGKKIILEDIESNTWLIATRLLEDQNEEGVLPVLPFGAPFEAQSFAHLKHVLIDAAASIGGAKNWINEIKPYWAAVFSLHATKSFGIGEGGLIIFGSKDMADKFRTWINFGFYGSRESLIIGTNGKMSEIQAAVGLSVLDNWNQEDIDWKKSREAADHISTEFGLSPTPTIQIGCTSPYWIIFNENPRVIERIESESKKLNIQTRKWWAHGCHLMPAFSAFKNSSLHFADTEYIASRYLGLPFYREISSMELSRIISALKNAQSIN